MAAALAAISWSMAAMRAFISGMNSISPSGTITTPWLMPGVGAGHHHRAMPSMICDSGIFFSATSSEIRATAGLTCSATSSATWEAARPISFTKCQYFREDGVSCRMLPVSSA